jgi:hypothetical protein
MLLVGCWLRWPGDCSRSRLTALLLERLLGVLLFTEARSMGRAVQWSPMKPESWSGWFPLKSSPTCSSRWLHCDLLSVPREHPNGTARTQRVNWFESSSWLKRLPRIALLMPWGGPKCRHRSQQFLCYYDSWLRLFCRWAVASKKDINKNVVREFVDGVHETLVCIACSVVAGHDWSHRNSAAG